MLVNYRESDFGYELYPVDDPIITIATVETEEEAQNLLTWINR